MSYTASASLPMCQSDLVSEDGWSTYWNPKRVVATSESGPTEESIEPDFTFSDLTRNELLTLTLSIEDQPPSRGVSLGLLMLPERFSTRTAYFEERPYSAEINGYERTELDGGARSLAQIRARLTKPNGLGYTLTVNESDGAKLSMPMEALAELFDSEGPLTVELWVEGRRLLQRRYQTRGVVSGFKEAVQRYEHERVRNQGMRCLYRPAYAIY